MDSPKMLLDRKNRKSLNSRRLSDSPKTPNRNKINVLSSPTSNKSENNCTTPQMRKKTFVTEESPSQDYDYFSPNRLSQEFDSRDVDWEWGDKASCTSKAKETSKTRDTEEEKVGRRRHFDSRKKSHRKHYQEGKRRSDQNKGFYKFKKEVEQLFQKSLTDENSSRDCSNSAPEKQDKTEDSSEFADTSSGNLCNYGTLTEKSNYDESNSNCKNGPPTARVEPSNSTDLLDNSEIDALLLEASQSAEEHLVKTGLATNTDKQSTVKISEDIIEINSDSDSVDEILLSFQHDEFMKSTESSTATQKNKTSFSRYNSMPPQPQERTSGSSCVKSFIRHSSMPIDNATSSSLGMSKSDNQKKICTKEEVERKKLEAKKRLLISQRKRLLLNSKNKALVLR